MESAERDAAYRRVRAAIVTLPQVSPAPTCSVWSCFQTSVEVVEQVIGLSPPKNKGDSSAFFELPTGEAQYMTFWGGRYYIRVPLRGGKVATFEKSPAVNVANSTDI